MSRRLFSLLGAVLLISCSADAHHSWTFGYQAGDIVEVEGVVKEIWFSSPHARVIVEMTNEAGEAELWEGETWPASVLTRRGWTYDKIAVGDTIVLVGERARGGRLGLYIQTIARPSDGWEAFVGLGSRNNFSPGKLSHGILKNGPDNRSPRGTLPTGRIPGRRADESRIRG